MRKATQSAVEIPIADIVVGKRHRRELGDIEALAASILELGLLHPVMVTPRLELIAGERRLRACQHLGRDTIPVTVVDLAEIVRGELAENDQRKPFTMSEAVAIKRAIEAVAKAEARQRKVMGGKLKSGATANLAHASGAARDLVAKRTGKGRTSLAKAEAVIAAAEAEPGNVKLARLVEAMDKSGRVDGPYRRLTNMRAAEVIRAEPPPLPNKGPYRVASIDPPWAFEADDDDPSERGARPYPTMSLAEICALDVAGLMAEDAIVWLWSTNFHMRAAYDVLEAWGFTAKSILTWIKPNIGQGAWLRSQTEHCILATRARPIVELRGHSTAVHAPAGAHSEKPASFYALVESLCPAPRYVELFARKRRRAPGVDGQDFEAVEAYGVERWLGELALALRQETSELGWARGRLPRRIRAVGIRWRTQPLRSPAMTAQRRRLPNYRRAETLDLACNGMRFTATFSRFEDGSAAEVFLSNHKAGSHADVHARNSAIAASLALQYGVPLDVLRGALLREEGGGASGPLVAALDLIATLNETT